jgi:CheY-like chemotaxis protein
MTGETYRILLAEDDRFLRKAAETTLKRSGFEVTTATDGEEALRAVGTCNPHLVLLDLIMPKIQGFEVLRSIKADPATAAIPVIVLSNLGQERDVQRAMEGGAAAYRIKANLSLDDLVKQVKQVLGLEATPVPAAAEEPRVGKWAKP